MFGVLWGECCSVFFVCFVALPQDKDKNIRQLELESKTVKKTTKGFLWSQKGKKQTNKKKKAKKENI